MAPRLPARCWRQLAPPTAPLARTATTPSSHSAAVAAAALPYSPALALRPLLPLTQTRTVKSGWSTLRPRDKPYRYDQVSSGLPAPTTGPAAALKRKEHSTPVRSGVLGIKKGMTVFMGRTGARIACTVLQLDRVQTVLNKTRATHGYWAVQVGMGERQAGNVGAPLLGYYEAKGIAPKEVLAEFRVRNEKGLLPVGVQLFPDWFHVGQRVDVRSNCRGKGFAGGMKRHGFAGQEASHGNSKNHRTIGTTGPSQGSGSRVLPGKKMPGRMGNHRVTVQNLPVLLVDNELGIVVVKGAVAGPKGAVVRIQDACKQDPPPQAFIDKTMAQLQERFPDAEAHLQAARERHLELKEARREKRIAELMAEGMKPSEAEAEAMEAIIAASVADDAATVAGAQPTF